MIKLRKNLGTFSAGELYEFFSQFPDETAIDQQIVDLLRAHLIKLNNKKRVARWRAKQRRKK